MINMDCIKLWKIGDPISCMSTLDIIGVSLVTIVIVLLVIKSFIK